MNNHSPPLQLSSMRSFNEHTQLAAAKDCGIATNKECDDLWTRAKSDARLRLQVKFEICTIHSCSPTT